MTPYLKKYGDALLQNFKVFEGTLTPVATLDHSLKGEYVVIRGVVDGKLIEESTISVMKVKERGHTVQVVVSIAPEVVNTNMVYYANGLCHGALVEVEGFVSAPDHPIKGTSQKVFITVRSIHSVCLSLPNLAPFVSENATNLLEEVLQSESKYLSDDQRALFLSRQPRKGFRISICVPKDADYALNTDGARSTDGARCAGGGIIFSVADDRFLLKYTAIYELGLESFDVEWNAMLEGLAWAFILGVRLQGAYTDCKGIQDMLMGVADIPWSHRIVFKWCLLLLKGIGTDCRHLPGRENERVHKLVKFCTETEQKFRDGVLIEIPQE